MTQTETFSSEVSAMVRAWYLLRKGNTVRVQETLGVYDPHSHWELQWEIAPAMRAAYICSGCGVTVAVGSPHVCKDEDQGAFRKVFAPEPEDESFFATGVDNSGEG